MSKTITLTATQVTSKTPFNKHESITIYKPNKFYSLLATIGNYMTAHPNMKFTDIIVHTEGFRGGKMIRFPATENGRFKSIIELLGEHIPHRFAANVGNTYVTFHNSVTNNATTLVIKMPH